MNVELPLVTLTIWFFLSKKASVWKAVAFVIDRLPGPALALWQAWMKCAYCGGFWIAMGTSGATGLVTLPALYKLPFVVALVLDGMVTALLALTGFLIIETMAAPIRAREEALGKK